MHLLHLLGLTLIYLGAVTWLYAVIIAVSRGRASSLAAWYDIWVGVFYDRKQRKIYLFLFPCWGLVISL